MPNGYWLGLNLMSFEHLIGVGDKAVLEDIAQNVTDSIDPNSFAKQRKTANTGEV
jgi:hypothetical protein